MPCSSKTSGCCSAALASSSTDVKLTGATPATPATAPITSRLCLICNNDVTPVLAVLASNPQVIKVQHTAATDLTIIVHDSSITTQQLIAFIAEQGFEACTAPSTTLCYVKAAPYVGDDSYQSEAHDTADVCCSSTQRRNSAETCSTAAPATTSTYWLRIAVALSLFSVCWEVLEGTASVFFGSANANESLWAFGADSLIEMLSALLIVWRFYAQLRGNAQQVDSVQRKEVNVTFAVGVLLLALAVATLGVSIHGLVTHDTPGSTVAGIVIAAVSWCVMLVLYVSKTVTGVRLQSSAVLSDATCTLCCMQLSACVFVSSLSYYLDPALWWFDSSFALAISLLIAREAVGMIKAAYTGQDTCCAPPLRDTWLVKRVKKHFADNVQQPATDSEPPRNRCSGAGCQAAASSVVLDVLPVEQHAAEGCCAGCKA